MKVTAWNTEGRLTRFAEAGRRGSPEQILDKIEALDSDIIVLPEASDADDIEPAVLDRIRGLGYQALTAHYSEKEDRTYKALTDPTIKLLSRVEVVDFQEIRLGDIRTMLMADVINPATSQPVRVFGIHIDDRNEANRLKQIEDLIPHINNSPYPAIVMGDFNAMHGDSFQARILKNKLVTAAASNFPHSKIRDVSERLVGMATGDTLRRIAEGTNLVQTNPKMIPTMTPKMRGLEWLPSVRLVQIDHIFVSPDIEFSDFQVASDGGSDHRAISVLLNTTRQNR